MHVVKDTTVVALVVLGGKSRTEFDLIFVIPPRSLRHDSPLQATGVSDVNEVIQKMVSQESTAESLMILTKENQVGRNRVLCHGIRPPLTRYVAAVIF